MDDITNYKLESLKISLNVKQKELLKELNKIISNNIYIQDLRIEIEKTLKKIEELENNSSGEQNGKN